MAWPKGTYPQRYQYLSDDTRDKAIQITHELLQQGMNRTEAVRIAYQRAIEWSRQMVRGGRPIAMVVAPCEDGWQIRTEGSDQAAMTFRTREEALRYARNSTRDNRTDIIVEGDEGEIHGRDA